MRKIFIYDKEDIFMFQHSEFPVMEVKKHWLDDHLFGILLRDVAIFDGLHCLFSGQVL